MMLRKFINELFDRPLIDAEEYLVNVDWNEDKRTYFYSFDIEDLTYDLDVIITDSNNKLMVYSEFAVNDEFETAVNDVKTSLDALHIVCSCIMDAIRKEGDLYQDHEFGQIIISFIPFPFEGEEDMSLEARKRTKLYVPMFTKYFGKPVSVQESDDKIVMVMAKNISIGDFIKH